MAAQSVNIGIAGLAQEQVMQGRGRPPLLMKAKRRAQSLAHNSPGAAFIAESVAPTAGARKLAAGIAAQRDRAGSGDGNDSRLGGMRSGQRDRAVVDQQQSAASKDLAQYRLLASRSTG